MIYTICIYADERQLCTAELCAEQLIWVVWIGCSSFVAMAN